LSLIAASGAFAQEYGRTNAGDLELITKGTRQMSGSFSLTRGNAAAKLFSASAGGALVADRIWFFASAARSSDNVLTNRYASTFPTASPSRAAAANVNAQLGDRQSLAAAFSSTRSAAIVPMASTNLSATNFSMNYTGIVSPSAFFTVSVSQHRAAVQP
jgi:hypothetical protein